MRAKELPARTLRDLRPGQSGRVGEVGGSGPLRTRLLELGLTPGVRVLVKKVAPFGDPIEISLRGYVLSLRKSQAQEITLAGR
ncbi:ferrous iron transport protein A [Neobittarella massiliensis]|uniref:Ferrous iron transport protein A n=2 Tax=Neobittarella massiliensis (ex Bilen et al. 2018) TaxID=2041842 RepID=A0A8J6IQ43_9FIRM|nr:FeoA family protein [Neobittarella massiliensis]MBC3517032.1 ferrous iron transport protein A [Neobittarella massiliensis]